MTIQLLKIGQQVPLQNQGAGGVIRRQHIALHFAENDFDLVQPTGPLRQPVESDLEGQLQRNNPRVQLLGSMGRTIVQNQVQDLQPAAV